jgi:hypothetical protein
MGTTALDPAFYSSASGEDRCFQPSPVAALDGLVRSWGGGAAARTRAVDHSPPAVVIPPRVEWTKRTARILAAGTVPHAAMPYTRADGPMGETGHMGAAAERARRDARVVGLFLAGLSYRDIAAVVGLRSPTSVGNIVQQEFGSPDSAARRGLLTDAAFAMWQERSERLLRAHWGRALDGNHRSAELCRKLLGQQAQVYGLAQEVALAAGTPTGVVEVEPVEPDMDELARLRAARAKA